MSQKLVEKPTSQQTYFPCYHWFSPAIMPTTKHSSAGGGTNAGKQKAKAAAGAASAVASNAVTRAAASSATMTTTTTTTTMTVAAAPASGSPPVHRALTSTNLHKCPPASVYPYVPGTRRVRDEIEELLYSLTARAKEVHISAANNRASMKQCASVLIQMTADAEQLDRSIEATMDDTQAKLFRS